jgi:N-acetylglucosaminyldiphosphoundecaprenol N-acetyl-beta-D-mannosaminyltransferase
MNNVPATDICGFQLLALRYPECVRHILRLLSKRQGAWILTLNLEILSTAKLDPEYESMIRAADYVLADGMPFVWVSRWKRGARPIPERTTGADISADLIVRFPASEIAIIGGVDPPQALEKLKVERRHEMFVFDGVVDMSPTGIEELCAKVREHGARLVFIALGVPKQDMVARVMREKLPEAVIIGVGGTFELIAGLKPRAPRWMQSSGLEWLFRLYVEPRRLWRRYLVIYWVGVLNIFADIFRRPRSSGR